jgi:hypothetical protein
VMLAIVALASACGHEAATARRAQHASPTVPVPTVPSTPPRSAPIAPGGAPNAWPTAPLVQTSIVDSPVSAPGTSVAYGVSPTEPATGYGRLTQIDLATGALTFGATIPEASVLFPLGQSVGVVLPRSEDSNQATTGPWSLSLVESGSVSITPELPLPFVASDYPPVVAGGPTVDGGDIWIGSGPWLLRVDVDSGRLEQSEQSRGSIVSLSVDPAGQLLYVALNEEQEVEAAGGSAFPSVVEELDARTGQLRAQTDGVSAVGSDSLVAVPGGVWDAGRSGMAGTALLRRAAGLAIVPVPPGSTPFDPIPTMGDEVIMGIWPVLLDSVVWLSGAAGASCLSASSGTLLSGAAFGSVSWAPFAEWGGRLYATSYGDTGEILVITPPAAC